MHYALAILAVVFISLLNLGLGAKYSRQIGHYLGYDFTKSSQNDSQNSPRSAASSGIDQKIIPDQTQDTPVGSGPVQQNDEKNVHDVSQETAAPQADIPVNQVSLSAVPQEQIETNIQTQNESQIQNSVNPNNTAINTVNVTPSSNQNSNNSATQAKDDSAQGSVAAGQNTATTKAAPMAANENDINKKNSIQQQTVSDPQVNDQKSSKITRQKKKL
jgi:hypothetical protein